MIDTVADLLACPHCAGPLTRDDRAFRCPSGHSFDLARQGHLNLLGRAAPAHADTAAMVAARKRFLGAGHYIAVTDAAAAAVQELTGPSPAVVEAGAGPGHHLAAVVEATGGRGLAVDVSPAACRAAARVHARVGAVVADVWAGIPVRDASADAVLCVFAPRNAGAFARVLRPDGVLVVVTPRPDHLAGLRERLGLLGVEAGKDARLEQSLTDRFDLVSDTEVRDLLRLARGEVADLVAMGPNAFHEPRTAVVDDLPEWTPVELAVRVSAWRPRPARR